MDINIICRVLTLILLTVWQLYWKVSGIQAHREKPKSKPSTTVTQHMSNLILHWFIGGVLGLQLLSIPIFPFQYPSKVLQVVGLFFVVSAVIASIIARRQLGSNWTSSFEFQIKHQQQLVTHGMYYYIRHPIYLCLPLIFIGGELVAQSYLVIPSLLLFYWAYWQAKKEDILLLGHFGKRYEAYMKKTKMLIPFIF